MFRISRHLRELLSPGSQRPLRPPPAPVVIWNLIRRCNLTCRHCYSISADRDFPDELDTAEVLAVMEDLHRFRVPALIFSGGEPLLRPDLPQIAARARELGFFTTLSTNGTRISERNIGELVEARYDYVGISLDGLRETHDRFRRREGAFDAALGGIRLCRDAGLKVGIRFTLTRDNAAELPALLKLMRSEQVDKFYLSHLNYAGRGNRNRGDDALFGMTRKAVLLLFETALADIEAGRQSEFVTGNNDADAVLLLHWARERFPGRTEALERDLIAWGGNATGINVANIDNLGNVHPDTYWWDHPLGNVRERPFSAIWSDESDPLLQGLRMRPRPLKGRCGTCRYQGICNGNTRVRARQLTGDPWAADPGCYLDDEEIGLPGRSVAGA